MTRARRNFLPVAGLLLGFAGVITYFTVVTTNLSPYFPFLRDVPVANLAIVGLGLVLSAAGIRRAFSRSVPHRGRALAPLLGTLNVALAGLFGWYLFDFSARLPDAREAPAAGTPAPEFALLDETGSKVSLSSLRGKNVLLVFYRGHW